MVEVYCAAGSRVFVVRDILEGNGPAKPYPSVFLGILILLLAFFFFLRLTSVSGIVGAIGDEVANVVAASIGIGMGSKVSWRSLGCASSVERPVSHVVSCTGASAVSSEGQ